MQIIRDTNPPGSHLFPFAESVDFLRAVGRGDQPSTLRMYQPAPNVAFGRRDELNPRFSTAQQACKDYGFVPQVRPVGGHAAAYHSGCLIIDHFQADADAVSGNMKRFTEFGQMFTDSLRTLDVQAQMGEIEGEYCPGEHSVHILLPNGTPTKIIGTAQRVVSGAWWFSTGIVVTNSEPLRDVTTAVYRNLGLPLKPSTVGALTDANPLIAIEDVEDAVLESLNQRGYC